MQSIVKAIAPVPETAKQAIETRRWSWVEASAWTDRMLAALDNGVKGSKWFKPNIFFAQRRLFTIHEAFLVARQSR
jgi:hypothetical protein